jgi:uncharacterized protein
MHLLLPSKIHIKASPGKGLGVFAHKIIYKGEIIEECPVFTISKPDTLMEFNDYHFNYPTGNDPTELVLPWGYGCLYNHSDTPNAYWMDHPKYKAFQYIAHRNIEVGEEITTYYGDDNYWDRRKHIKKL